MNRLKGHRAYLCGAMEAAADKGIGWRDEVTQWLQNDFGIIVIDPAKKPTDMVPEHADAMAARRKMKLEGRWIEYQAECRQMRCVDLRLIDIVDLMIVNVDRTVFTVGTWEELFWANRGKKPIIVHMVQGKLAAPDWLFGTLPHQMIFSTWDEVKGYLLHIHNDVEINHLKRWLFFDRSKL